MAKLQSPLESYVQLKKQHPDTILLFRIGDFCEFFGEDATTVAAILGLTITTRKEQGKPEQPMAGFPAHYLDAYLAKLVQSGNRVALVESVSNVSAVEPIEETKPANKYLIDSESYRLGDHRILAKQSRRYRYMIVELDGSEDGSLVAKFEKKEVLLAVCTAMGWEISENLCNES